MQNEFRLKVGKSSRTLTVRGEGFRFCREAFLNVVEGLPKGTEECVLVATKEVTEDSFSIKAPRTYRFDNKRHSSLTRIRGNFLYPQTRYKLARLYDAGYRAVHIEYEV